MATPKALLRSLLVLSLCIHFIGLKTVDCRDHVNFSENKSTIKSAMAFDNRLSILLTTGHLPGHLYPITALGAELVKRGHNVTLCAPVMEGSNILPDLPESYGIKFVSAGSANITQDEFAATVRELQSPTVSAVNRFFGKFQESMVTVRSKVDEIGVENFDLIVGEYSINPIASYCNKLGKRVILLSPVITYVEATRPEWPSPNPATGLTDNLTFLSRIANTISGLALKMYQNSVINGVMDLDEDYARVLKGVDAFSYYGIQIPLIVTTAFGFEYPKTRYPLTHYVGPLMMDSFPPLEHQLMEWLNKKTNKTVIYVGMGSTGSITADMAKAILNGILATDFSAVWALPMSDQTVLEGMDIDEERFYISKWIPRQTLFKHPTLVMTILHCGMNGVLESLYNGLPVVCLTCALDHFAVAARVVSAKVGISFFSMMDHIMNRKKLTPANITDAVKTITETKDYSEQAKKMREIFMFAGGAQRASDLVEFYAEVGYDHLIPAYVKYEWSWVQYYNLDVHCLLLLILFSTTYISYRVVRCSYRICCSKCSKVKKE